MSLGLGPARQLVMFLMNPLCKRLLGYINTS